jgi:hypothetical protein
MKLNERMLADRSIRDARMDDGSTSGERDVRDRACSPVDRAPVARAKGQYATPCQVKKRRLASRATLTG